MIAAWLAAPEAEAAKLLFASLRPGAALALLPGIGGALLPLRVRIGLAGVLGYLGITLHGVAAPAAGDIAGAVAGELLIGAALGVMLQAVFAAASIAGEVLSQSMGLGFATILGPGGLTSPVLASFLGLALWAVFIATDGHARLFVLIVESWATLPPGGTVSPGAVLALGGQAFAAGALLAAPVAGVLLLANLWLAVLAKSAPQLNVFAIGFAVLTAAGLAALPLAWPAMTATMHDIVDDGGAAMAGAVTAPLPDGEGQETREARPGGGSFTNSDIEARARPTPGPPQERRLSDPPRRGG